MSQRLIRWNEWSGPSPKSRLPDVTVVIPHYRQPGPLRVTLCALAHQDYPMEQLQVIVADDGSPEQEDLPRASDYPFDLHVVRQEHDGFGLARARNLGATTAEGSRLIFLDADMVPERDLVSAHVHELQPADYVISIGDRLHVRSDIIDPARLDGHLAAGGTLGVLYRKQAATGPAWRKDYLRRSDDLRTDHAEGYRLASGGNLGVHKDFYLDVGGNDGTFRQWGGEDLEFAYRATQCGALFRFNANALAWHQGEEAVTATAERISQEEQLPLLVNKMATRYVRSRPGGRVYAVPHLTVALLWSPGLEAPIQSLVDELLQHPMGVHVHVLGVEQERAHRILTRAYCSDPRVQTSVGADLPADLVNAGPVPLRAFLHEPGAVDASAVLEAARLLESAVPRLAVIDLERPREQRPVGMVWTAAATSRASRCSELDATFETLLGHAARVMGRGRVVIGSRHCATTVSSQDAHHELDVLEQQLRQFYWGLSPRTKRLVLRSVNLARGLAKR
jgi:GT2 family glycosyltransferase